MFRQLIRSILEKGASVIRFCTANVTVSRTCLLICQAESFTRVKKRARRSGVTSAAMPSG